MLSSFKTEEEQRKFIYHKLSAKQTKLVDNLVNFISRMSSSSLIDGSFIRPI